MAERRAPQHAWRDYSEATARQVDVAIHDMIDGAFEDAKKLLSTRTMDLTAGANLLLEHKTITPEDFLPLQRKAGDPKTATTTEATVG